MGLQCIDFRIVSATYVLSTSVQLSMLSRTTLFLLVRITSAQGPDALFNHLAHQGPEMSFWAYLGDIFEYINWSRKTSLELILVL